MSDLVRNSEDRFFLDMAHSLDISLQVVVTDQGCDKMGQCRSVNDPHITTPDGTYVP